MSTKLLTHPSKLPSLSGREVVLDTETTGLMKMIDVPFMLQMEISGTTYAVEFDEICSRYLNDELPKSKLVIGHNLKFDLHMCIQGGVREDIVRNLSIWDTMIAENLINENQHSFSLDALCKKYFKHQKNDDRLIKWIQDNILKKSRKRSPTEIRREAFAHLSEAPRDLVAEYGINDVVLTRKLYNRHRELIHQKDSRLSMLPEQVQSRTHVMNLEMDVLKTLVEVERRGVYVDIEKTEQLEEELLKLREDVIRENNKLAGEDWNQGSILERERIFNKLGLHIFRTDKGNPSFSKTSLEKESHPIATNLLEITAIDKIVNTYTTNIKRFYNPATKRIHCDFMQIKGEEGGAKTGRFSCQNPNLQNIPNPKRCDKGSTKERMSRLVRSAYQAEQGQSWLSCDWSQFENRVFAHFSRDEKLINSFIENPDVDYHNLVAELMDVPRLHAKTINLGLIFGMGPGKLADQMSLPWEWAEFTAKDGKHVRYQKPGIEAEELFENYHETFPTVKPVLKGAENLVRSRGFILSLSGRRMHIDKQFAYKAGSHLFQGNAACIMKRKAVEINNALRGTSADLLLIVHDEFNVTCPKDEVEKYEKIVLEIMEDVPELDVPIRATSGIGDDWYIASK